MNEAESARGVGPGVPKHEDSAFGRLPLLATEREYGTLGAHTTCFAYAIATWCFLTGVAMRRSSSAPFKVWCAWWPEISSGCS